MAIPLARIFRPLSEEERWALERFVARVDRLRASRFAQSESGLRATLIPGATVLGGPAWQIAIDGPPEEAVREVIGDFRQLYKDAGQTSAAKVISILKHSARERDTDAGRAMITRLKELTTIIERRRKADPRGKLLEEDAGGVFVERSPHDILNTWFNGEYFHDDRELAMELSPDGHASVEMMRLGLHTTIRDYLSYWTTLRELAGWVLEDRVLAGSPLSTYSSIASSGGESAADGGSPSVVAASKRSHHSARSRASR